MTTPLPDQLRKLAANIWDVSRPYLADKLNEAADEIERKGVPDLRIHETQPGPARPAGPGLGD